MHHDVTSLEADSSIRKLHLTKLGEGKVTLSLHDGSTTEKKFSWYECTESADSIVDLYKFTTEQGGFFNAIVTAIPKQPDQPYQGLSYGSIAYSELTAMFGEAMNMLAKEDTMLFYANGELFAGSIKQLQLLDTISFGPVLIFKNKYDDNDAIVTPMDADYHPYNGTAEWKDLEVIVEKLDYTIYFL